MTTDFLDLPLVASAVVAIFALGVVVAILRLVYVLLFEFVDEDPDPDPAREDAENRYRRNME